MAGCFVYFPLQAAPRRKLQKQRRKETERAHAVRSLPPLEQMIALRHQAALRYQAELGYELLGRRVRQVLLATFRCSTKRSVNHLPLPLQRHYTSFHARNGETAVSPSLARRVSVAELLGRAIVPIGRTQNS